MKTWMLGIVMCIIVSGSLDGRTASFELRNITPREKTVFREFTFSPDGQQIAFEMIWDKPKKVQGDWDIHTFPHFHGIGVMNRDGSAFQQLTHESLELGFGYRLCWSPDGTRISCDTFPYDADFYRGPQPGPVLVKTAIIELATKAIEYVEYDVKGKTVPSWTPDNGHEIIMIPEKESTRYWRERYNSDGTENPDSLFFLLSGQKLFINKREFQLRSLWTKAGKDGKPQRLMSELEFGWIKVAPNNEIALVMSRQGTLYLIRARGGERTEVARSHKLPISKPPEQTISEVEWSPDCKSAVFCWGNYPFRFTSLPIAGQNPPEVWMLNIGK